MLRKLAGDCSDGVSCPAAWTDDQDQDQEGIVLVQGYRAADPEGLPPVPDGEARVRIPRAILLQAAQELR
jgi:hypothetical protein